MSEYFTKKIIDEGKGAQEVTVAYKPMTQEKAREFYVNRPYSKYAETRWGGNNMVDDTALLINELAQRCTMCQAPTKNALLRDGVCPDCSGRAEYHGASPFKKYSR